jgi:hypothetical protein
MLPAISFLVMEASKDVKTHMLTIQKFIQVHYKLVSSRYIILKLSILR